MTHKTNTNETSRPNPQWWIQHEISDGGLNDQKICDGPSSNDVWFNHMSTWHTSKQNRKAQTQTNEHTFFETDCISMGPQTVYYHVFVISLQLSSHSRWNSGCYHSTPLRPLNGIAHCTHLRFCFTLDWPIRASCVTCIFWVRWQSLPQHEHMIAKQNKPA